MSSYRLCAICAALFSFDCDLMHFSLLKRESRTQLRSTQPCIPSIEYQLRLGQRLECRLCRGWQVTLCDPIWHVSSSSGVATSVSELLYPCYLLTYLHVIFWAPTIKVRSLITVDCLHGSMNNARYPVFVACLLYDRTTLVVHVEQTARCVCLYVRTTNVELSDL